MRGWFRCDTWFHHDYCIHIIRAGKETKPHEESSSEGGLGLAIRKPFSSQTSLLGKTRGWFRCDTWFHHDFCIRIIRAAKETKPHEESSSEGGLGLTIRKPFSSQTSLLGKTRGWFRCDTWFYHDYCIRIIRAGKETKPHEESSSEGGLGLTIRKPFSSQTSLLGKTRGWFRCDTWFHHDYCIRIIRAGKETKPHEESSSEGGLGLTIRKPFSSQTSLLGKTRGWFRCDTWFYHDYCIRIIRAGKETKPHEESSSEGGLGLTIRKPFSSQTSLLGKKRGLFRCDTWFHHDYCIRIIRAAKETKSHEENSKEGGLGLTIRKPFSSQTSLLGKTRGWFRCDTWFHHDYCICIIRAGKETKSHEESFSEGGLGLTIRKPFSSQTSLLGKTRGWFRCDTWFHHDYCIRIIRAGKETKPLQESSSEGGLGLTIRKPFSSQTSLLGKTRGWFRCDTWFHHDFCIRIIRAAKETKPHEESSSEGGLGLTIRKPFSSQTSLLGKTRGWFRCDTWFYHDYCIRIIRAGKETKPHEESCSEGGLGLTIRKPFSSQTSLLGKTRGWFRCDTWFHHDYCIRIIRAGKETKPHEESSSEGGLGLTIRKPFSSQTSLLGKTRGWFRCDTWFHHDYCIRIIRAAKETKSHEESSSEGGLGLTIRKPFSSQTSLLGKMRGWFRCDTWFHHDYCICIIRAGKKTKSHEESSSEGGLGLTIRKPFSSQTSLLGKTRGWFRCDTWFHRDYCIRIIRAGKETKPLQESSSEGGLGLTIRKPFSSQTSLFGEDEGLVQM